MDLRLESCEGIIFDFLLLSCYGEKLIYGTYAEIDLFKIEVDVMEKKILIGF